MDVKTILLCLVAVIGHASSYESYFEQPFSYRSGSDSKERDDDGSSGELKSSELMYSGEFESDDQPFTSFRDEFLKNETELMNKKELSQTEPYESSDRFGGESFEDEEDGPKYKPDERKYEASGGSLISEISSNTKDQVTKATERNKNLEEEIPKTLHQGKESHWNDKPIAPISTNNHYPGFPKKPDDVEVILPQEESIFLPLVNGKPKPYDGYRAAPETDSENIRRIDKMKESPEQRERRLTLGEIIYGKPRVALRPKHLLQKRSTLEYDGGIQPHYDFSDSKLTWTAVKSGLPKTETSLQKRRADYPDDFYATSHDDFFRSFKAKLEAGDAGRKNDHSYYSEESYEASSEETEEPDESQYESAYASDNQFKIAHATIKVLDLGDNSKNNQEDVRQANSENNKKNSKVFPHNSGTFIGLSETPEEALNNSPFTWHGEQQENLDQDHKVPENIPHKNITRSINSYKINETPKLSKKRSKRSAKDAHNLDLVPQSEKESGRKKDDSFDVDHFSRAKADLRIDYKRPNLFNFQPTNKKYTGNSGFSGYNTYNIYNRPKSLVNWNGSTKQSHSFNSESESSKSHGGSFTYKVPEKSYGVPASIYKDLFQSSEKIDEPYDNVKEKEYSKNQEYSQRAFSTSRYHNEYNTKQSERNAKHHHPQHRPYYLSKGHSFPQRNFHSEPRYRPKKNAQQDKFRFQGVVRPRQVIRKENESGKVVKTGKPEERKPQEFPAFESHLTLTKQFNQEPSLSDVKKSNGKDSCKKEKRGEMLCTVCTNEKTAATYEQCQFSAKSSESEKYYEYKKQESGNSPMLKKIKQDTDSANQKPMSHQITMAIFKDGKEGQESMALKTPSTDFHTSSNIFQKPDPKRILRKTERRQALGDEDNDYRESQYEVEESNEEGSSGMAGNDGLTFGSFGDDFSKAFVEFGRHVNEDMFHRGFSEEEGFGSDDRFDFDALSFEDTGDDEEGMHSEEEFSF